MDIVSGSPQGFIVTGFFTPNYRPYAEAFAKNLREHNVPHHLYLWHTETWGRAILFKPHVVERAAEDYPNTPILMMDVDCRVRGSLADHLPVAGDVALPIRVKLRRGRRKHRASTWASSRASLWNPTEPAARLLGKWKSLCEAELQRRDYIDDELAFMMAIGSTPGVHLNVLPDRLSALNPTEAPLDAIITHESAHDRQQLMYPFWQGIKDRRRAVVSWVIGKPYQEWRYGRPLVK